MNQLTLMGRIVRKPALQITDVGIPYTRFVLAVDRVYKKSKSTDYIHVIVWRRQAEVVCKYLDKGSSVLVNGYLHSDSYTFDNEKRYVLEVVVHDIKFLERKIKKESDEPAKEEIIFAGFDHCEDVKHV